MPASLRLVDAYREILGNTQEMLHLATAGEWEAVVGMQSRVLMSIASLSELHATRPVAEEDRVETMAVLKSLVITEAQVKKKLLERKEELARLLKTAEDQNDNGGFGRVVRSATYDRKDLERKKRK